MIWRLAWRNLWRHRGRTLIMTSAVAGAYGLMLVSMGVSDDGHGRMLREATLAAGGDVIIHGKGYWDTRASDVVIHDADAVLDHVRETDGVGLALPRIIVTGLVATSAGARPVLLQAVQPEVETQFNDIADDVTRGTFLEDERADPIVLGARIVEELELELGGRVVLTASRPDGEVTRALFHLTGVLETGTPSLDELLGYTTLEAARRTVGMDGMLTQIGVLAADGATGGGDGVAIAIEEALGAAAADLEILPWSEAVPEMVGFIELDDAFGYIYLAVILLVVMFSVTNTFLMAVMERVRELGLLSALGLRGTRIGHLMIYETILMTALAMGIGFAFGLGGHLAIDHWGIPLSLYGLDEMEVSGVNFAELVIHSSINPMKWLIGTLFVAGATILSAVYPAWRATRLAPAEAMRFYE
jgi:ABC-type lipoprotein release transport system permease subunit